MTSADLAHVLAAITPWDAPALLVTLERAERAGLDPSAAADAIRNAAALGARLDYVETLLALLETGNREAHARHSIRAGARRRRLRSHHPKGSR